MDSVGIPIGEDINLITHILLRLFAGDGANLFAPSPENYMS